MDPDDTRTNKVAARLQRAIEQGEYAEGSQLPAERDLATQYGVSRVTIRRALAELELTGFIKRRGTSGTFVNPKADRLLAPNRNGPIPQMPTDLDTRPAFPFAPDPVTRSRSGLWSEHLPRNRIVDLGSPETIETNQYLARRMQLPHGSLAIRRVRLVMHNVFMNPYELWDTYYPARVLEGALTSSSDANAIDQWLREQYGNQRKRVTIEGQVRFPTAHEAFWLHTSRQTPLVDIERLVYSTHGDAFELLQGGNVIELSRVATLRDWYSFWREYEEEELQPRPWIEENEE